MDLGLNGKVAIVAASSKGLGRAVATGLAREGALVTVNGREESTLAETAAAIRDETGADVLEIAGNLTDTGVAERLVEETVRARGRLDVLVCNSGGPPAGTFEAFPDDEPWRQAYELNLITTLRLARAALPHLEASGGSITNIVSTAVKQPIPHLILSNTARAAVIGLAKSLALEYAPRGVRVNNVLPGSTLTNRIRSLAATRAEAAGRPVEDVLAEDAAAIPMGRFSTPEEFANVVVFLASPAAAYVTGATLQVDGGAIRGTL